MAWGAKRRETRHGNTKVVTHSGRSFASKFENELFNILSLREKAGEFSNLRCQVRVSMTQADIVYIPDFAATLPNGEMKYFEAKGHETDMWRLKRRLWKFYGPGALEVWKGTYRRPVLFETIIPSIKRVVEDDSEIE